MDKFESYTREQKWSLYMTSKLKKYVDFLDRKFDILSYKQCELLFRYFDIPFCINYCSRALNIDEIREYTNLTDVKTYDYTRKLYEAGLLTRVRKKVLEYSNVDILDDCFLQEFEKYIKCEKCGKRFSTHGGNVHTNICQEVPEHVYCKNCLYCLGLL